VCWYAHPRRGRGWGRADSTRLLLARATIRAARARRAQITDWLAKFDSARAIARRPPPSYLRPAPGGAPRAPLGAARAAQLPTLEEMEALQGGALDLPELPWDKSWVARGKAWRAWGEPWRAVIAVSQAWCPWISGWVQAAGTPAPDGAAESGGDKRLGL